MCRAYLVQIQEMIGVALLSFPDSASPPRPITIFVMEKQAETLALHVRTDGDAQ
jgi:hypothetical protein